LIVAKATLGTINHTLLTIEAVERDGCAIAAVVLSRRPEDDDAFARSNANEIARRWPGQLMILGEELNVLDPLL
jgi:dethiobiotin synthetase